MDKKICFIGCGNMGKAIMHGLVSSELFKRENITGSSPSYEKLIPLKEMYGINITTDNIKAAQSSDIIVLSVKPDKYEKVLSEISPYIEDKLILSIAAGINIDKIYEFLGRKVKVIRAMPNTPLMVNEGITALIKGDAASIEDLELIKKIFSSCGDVVVLEKESQIDSIIAISGSSTAYAYLFIEALAEAGVYLGLKFDESLKISAKAVRGASKMILESKKHPSQLKNEVSSPGGTTIEALYSLEKNGFKGIVMEAAIKCFDKARDMAK